MNILKLCLVAVLVFWLISEFAPEDVSAVTSMLGIAVAVVAMILYNKKQNSDDEQGEYGDSDDYDDDYEEDKLSDSKK
ncbi:hypothetical protein D081_1662 [Anaerovibrio sp. JC8]|uniref:hypothetical protein n=1 Tax=Anaerovibrio sp. JC8 TaxID=1240085 RepID=UPI000A0D4599|nr:hypothetical protein [Anaerovibrio sp. JC8]ORT99778.1 hypothetical protein D081_1662 [Anaerovibrio sp. JC8]